MPKTVILATLVVAVVLGLRLSPGAAQQPSTSSLAKAQDVIEITNAVAMARQVMTRTLSLQIETLRKARPNIPEKFWATFEKNFNAEIENRIGDLTTQFAKLYALKFTEQELDDILMFYRSDTGRKAIREMPKLTHEGMTLGAQWGREIGEIAVKQTLESLNKKKE